MEQLRWRSQVPLVGTIWQGGAGERPTGEAVILYVVHKSLGPEGVVSQGAPYNSQASYSGVNWLSPNQSFCIRHFMCISEERRFIRCHLQCQISGSTLYQSLVVFCNFLMDIKKVFIDKLECLSAIKVPFKVLQTSVFNFKNKWFIKHLIDDREATFNCSLIKYKCIYYKVLPM